MKKRCIGLLIAALVLVQPVAAFAAGSVSGGNSMPSAKGGEYRPMTSNDAISVSGADGNTPTVTVGNTAVSFVGFENAGLTDATVETIKTINAGTTPLYRAIGTTTVVGYSALAPIQVMAAADLTTGQAVTQPVALSMYVPNLIQGLGDIQVLYYNKTTKAWELVAPSAIDYATKQITVNVADGTPFTIVYKK